MEKAKSLFGRTVVAAFAAATLFGTLGSVGCTVHTNGMTIPSDNWIEQRVQYFPTGPQYQFTNEETMMEASKAESTRQR